MGINRTNYAIERKIQAIELHLNGLGKFTIAKELNTKLFFWCLKRKNFRTILDSTRFPRDAHYRIRGIDRQYENHSGIFESDNI
jgi:hypothetical protein